MGFFDKIKAGLEKTRRQMGGVFAEFTGENEEFYDELEEALIVADSGADTAFRAVAALREKVREEGLRGRTEINAALVEILTELLSVGSFELKLETKPSVILMAVSYTHLDVYKRQAQIRRRYERAGCAVHGRARAGALRPRPHGAGRRGSVAGDEAVAYTHLV